MKAPLLKNNSDIESYELLAKAKEESCFRSNSIRVVEKDSSWINNFQFFEMPAFDVPMKSDQN